MSFVTTSSLWIGSGGMSLSLDLPITARNVLPYLYGFCLCSINFSACLLRCSLLRCLFMAVTKLRWWRHLTQLKSVCVCLASLKSLSLFLMLRFRVLVIHDLPLRFCLMSIFGMVADAASCRMNCEVAVSMSFSIMLPQSASVIILVRRSMLILRYSQTMIPDYDGWLFGIIDQCRV